MTIRTDTALINHKSLKLETIEKIEHDTNMEILQNQLKHLQAGNYHDYCFPIIIIIIIIFIVITIALTLIIMIIRIKK